MNDKRKVVLVCRTKSQADAVIKLNPTYILVAGVPYIGFEDTTKTAQLICKHCSNIKHFKCDVCAELYCDDCIKRYNEKKELLIGVCECGLLICHKCIKAHDKTCACTSIYPSLAIDDD